MLTDFDTPATRLGAGADTSLTRFMAGELPPAECLEALWPPMHECSTLLVACRAADYSASLLARAVEDVDLQLLSLAVTSMHLPGDESGRLVVALRINSSSTRAATQSLERYGIATLWTSSPMTEAEQDVARERVNELLHYLDL